VVAPPTSERDDRQKKEPMGGMFTMKTKHLIRTGALAIVAGLAFSAAASAQDAMVLKSADVHPVGYPTVQAVEDMGKKLSDATNGRLSIQVYPSMQLGGEKEFLEQTQLGAIAFARVSLGVMGAIIPTLNVFNLPFVFRSTDHMYAVVDGPLGDEMLQAITDHPTANLVGLAWMDGGARNLYNGKVPVAKMEDLNGLKIRVMGNPIFVDMMNAIGGNGVSMGYDQLINALQTGVVDGAENNYPSYATGQHYNYAKYYSLTGHLIIPEILVMSKTVWNSLSKEDQDLVKKLAREAQAEQRALWKAKEQESLADMKAHDVVITEITPEEKARFQAAMKPVYEKHAADLQELIARIQEVQ
jgi:tripartite ATP-independent transporter DctP family solute receptor